MKRMIKYAAAAGVAGLLAIGLSMPSQAAPRGTMAPAAGYRMTAPSAQNGYRHRAPAYAYDQDDNAGYGAYAFAPTIGHAMSPYSCSIEGTYGKPVDHANCY